MPTIHCPECEPEKPCDGGHIYVIELGHGIEEKYPYKHRLHVYVGETQNTVPRRMQSNRTRADKETVLTEEEARADAYGDDWHFKSTGIKKIRAHYVGYLTDLYFNLNPIPKDRDALKDAEKKLARKLERAKENGIRKYHVHGDGKKKKRKKNKEQFSSKTALTYRDQFVTDTNQNAVFTAYLAKTALR